MAVAEPLTSHSSRAVSTPAEPKPLRWTMEQYYKLGEFGFFEGRRVELIDGEIIEMSPMTEPHWAAVTLLSRILHQLFGAGYTVGVQVPLNLGHSEPEPDAMVVAGHPRDYKQGKPQTALLVVEVSLTTLDYDRTDKASLYASAGVPEYWIANLADRQLEVYRRPEPHPEQRFGFGYMDLSVHRPQSVISPLAAPQARIAIADLLP